MKKIFKMTVLFAILAIYGCRKEEKLNVDYSSFNADNPQTNTLLDQWLKSNFLDAYNIDVVYRYNRYYHGNSANVVPSKLENIKPTMQIVLDGFISPYRKIAGETFTKKYMPKEWVLFGSNGYANVNDPGVAGTAEAGRRITLYGVNEYQPLPAGQFYAWDRHRIMHHEFTHILNQIIPIPVDFESISKGFYKQPYTDTDIDTARRNGFVTSYASSVYTEDYAETVCYLLINGQVWYNDWANFANAAGKSRFTQKENNAIAYFTNLGIDFKALQMEVQKYMTSIGRNETKFAYWLSKARKPLVTPAPNPAPAALPTFKTLTINPYSDYNLKYSGSANFKELYDNVNARITAQGYPLNFLKLNFISPTTMYVEANYSSGGVTYQSFYTYNMAVDVATSQVKFTTATPGGTNSAWVGNAAYTKPSIQPFLDFLLNNTFVADFLPVNVIPADYMTSAGFTVLGAPTNYFYGQLTY